MNVPELISQVKEVADRATAQATEYTGVIEQAKGYVVNHFGESGLIAAYIAGGVLLLFVLTRLAKLTLSAVKYLVIPSVALAFLASVFLPLTFAVALPVSVTVCSLFLLFKG